MLWNSTLSKKCIWWETENQFRAPGNTVSQPCKECNRKKQGNDFHLLDEQVTRNSNEPHSVTVFMQPEIRLCENFVLEAN